MKKPIYSFKKGVHSMIDVCPHCHQMTHKILNYHMLMFCLFCNKNIW